MKRGGFILPWTCVIQVPFREESFGMVKTALLKVGIFQKLNITLKDAMILQKLI